MPNIPNLQYRRSQEPSIPTPNRSKIAKIKMMGGNAPYPASQTLPFKRKGDPYRLINTQGSPPLKAIVSDPPKRPKTNQSQKNPTKPQGPFARSDFQTSTKRNPNIHQTVETKRRTDQNNGWPYGGCSNSSADIPKKTNSICILTTLTAANTDWVHGREGGQPVGNSPGPRMVTVKTPRLRSTKEGVDTSDTLGNA